MVFNMQRVRKAVRQCNDMSIWIRCSTYITRYAQSCKAVPYYLFGGLWNDSSVLRSVGRQLINAGDRTHKNEVEDRNCGGIDTALLRDAGST